MLLKNGAKRVPVDVGYGQLAWELRNNPKVVCMERTNFRYITREQISELLISGLPMFHLYPLNLYSRH